MLDLLSKTGKLGVKPCSSPMVLGVHLTREDEHLMILRDLED